MQQSELEQLVTQLVQHPQPISEDVALVAPLENVLEKLLTHGLRDLHYLRKTRFEEYAVGVSNCLPDGERLLLPVRKLTYVRSALGRSRAIVRAWLNMGALWEAVHALTWDKQWTHQFYVPSATLADPELCEMLLAQIRRLCPVGFHLGVDEASLDRLNVFVEREREFKRTASLNAASAAPKAAAGAVQRQGAHEEAPSVVQNIVESAERAERSPSPSQSQAIPNPALTASALRAQTVVEHEVLLTELNRAIQATLVASLALERPVCADDLPVTRLMSAVLAIFEHGLQQASRSIARPLGGGRRKTMWDVVSTLPECLPSGSVGPVLQAIRQSTSVVTARGRCGSFVRHALNTEALADYARALTWNHHVISSLYEPGALLADEEGSQVAVMLLESLNAIRFVLFVEDPLLDSLLGAGHSSMVMGSADQSAWHGRHASEDPILVQTMSTRPGSSSAGGGIAIPEGRSAAAALRQEGVEQCISGSPVLTVAQVVQSALLTRLSRSIASLAAASLESDKSVSLEPLAARFWFDLEAVLTDGLLSVRHGGPSCSSSSEDGVARLWSGLLNADVSVRSIIAAVEAGDNDDVASLVRAALCAAVGKGVLAELLGGILGNEEVRRGLYVTDALLCDDESRAALSELLYSLRGKFIELPPASESTSVAAVAETGVVVLDEGRGRAASFDWADQSLRGLAREVSSLAGSAADRRAVGRKGRRVRRVPMIENAHGEGEVFSPSASSSVVGEENSPACDSGAAGVQPAGRRSEDLLTASTPPSVADCVGRVLGGSFSSDGGGRTSAALVENGLDAQRIPLGESPGAFVQFSDAASTNTGLGGRENGPDGAAKLCSLGLEADGATRSSSPAPATSPAEDDGVGRSVPDGVGGVFDRERAVDPELSLDDGFRGAVNAETGPEDPEGDRPLQNSTGPEEPEGDRPPQHSTGPEEPEGDRPPQHGTGPEEPEGDRPPQHSTGPEEPEGDRPPQHSTGFSVDGEGLRASPSHLTPPAVGASPSPAGGVGSPPVVGSPLRYVMVGMAESSRVGSPRARRRAARIAEPENWAALPSPRGDGVSPRSHGETISAPRAVPVGVQQYSPPAQHSAVLAQPAPSMDNELERVRAFERQRELHRELERQRESEEAAAALRAERLQLEEQMERQRKEQREAELSEAGADEGVRSALAAEGSSESMWVKLAREAARRPSDIAAHEKAAYARELEADRRVELRARAEAQRRPKLAAGMEAGSPPRTPPKGPIFIESPDDAESPVTPTLLLASHHHRSPKRTVNKIGNILRRSDGSLRGGTSPPARGGAHVAINPGHLSTASGSSRRESSGSSQGSERGGAVRASSAGSERGGAVRASSVGSERAGAVRASSVSTEKAELVPQRAQAPQPLPAQEPRLLVRPPPRVSLSAQCGACAQCGGELKENVLSWMKGSIRQCAYTGLFYCNECHRNGETVLPARLLWALDRHKYKVCVASERYLSAVYRQPILKASQLNPELSKTSRELHDVKALRLRLRYISEFVHTCRERTKLLAILDDRAHLMDSPFAWSMQDLVDTSTGALARWLETRIRRFAAHITSTCGICKAKGYFCEFCHSNQLVYPFERSAVQCSGCRAFYHSQCYIKKDCPKCARIARLRAEKAQVGGGK